MKLFFKFFAPPTLLSALVWWLLVGSQREIYLDCREFGAHDPSLCQDHNPSLALGITVILCGLAFFTATLSYFAKRA